ncbi:hypothetical protein PIB30_085488 [Stylosanthes scabra]|uniref:Uncharacterized protein n=1 Tax=Stylosanthes scabra TaxID=79078 RepID=A0ABU6YQF9_9FABA|nr:hypothetical protein [Stylosanthes scabra]
MGLPRRGWSICSTHMRAPPRLCVAKGSQGMERSSSSTHMRALPRICVGVFLCFAFKRPPPCGIGGSLQAPPARRGRRGGRHRE